jgi:cytochrome o ubiquinol oxidase subunit 1
VLPTIEGEEAYWDIKQLARERLTLRDEPVYAEIEMPKNSPTGFVCAFFASIMGFALIWHIWWMVAVAAAGAFATFVVFAWRDEDEYIIPADEVARIDRANRSARSAVLKRLAQMQAAQ